MNNFIEKLDWDSHFFGFKVGRIKLQTLEQPLDLEQMGQSDYRLIYVFSEESLDLNAFYSQRINYQKKLKLTPEKKEFVGEKHPAINLATSSDIEQKEIQDLALIAGKYSRFSLDPMFPEGTTNSMYKAWLSQAMENSTHKIAIYKEEEQLKGFIQYQILEDSIRIIFISVKKAYQNQGIASALLDFVNGKALDLKKKTIEVITQNLNEEAKRLYIKKGFTIASKPYIYHVWNPIS